MKGGDGVAVRSLAQQVGQNAGQIKGMLMWQERQNGSLQRLERRVARLELLLVLAIGLGVVQVLHIFGALLP